MTTAWSTIVRVAVTIGATFLAAVLSAIAAAVVDLYVAGHGYPSILRPWIEWPAAGIHLSRADAAMLVASTLAGWGAWRATKTR